MASRKPSSPVLTLEQQIDHLVAQETTGYAGRAALSLPPARVAWSEGEAARVGNLDKATVVRVIEDGRRLVLHTEHHHERHGLQTQLMVRPWFEVQKESLKSDVSFARRDSLQLNYQQSTVADLLGKKFHLGMDDAPAYQRDLVWTVQQKQDLVESMFNHVDIGKFVLIDLEFEENRAAYEILDGKQRLNALVSFVGDQFDHQGVRFSQMSAGDRHFLMEYPVSLARVPEHAMNWEQRLDLFLRMNTSGTPQSVEHLDHVRRLREQAREARHLTEMATQDASAKPTVGPR